MAKKNDKAAAAGVDGVTLREYLRATVKPSVAAVERNMAEAEAAALQGVYEADTPHAIVAARALARALEALKQRADALANNVEIIEARELRRRRQARGS